MIGDIIHVDCNGDVIKIKEILLFFKLLVFNIINYIYYNLPAYVYKNQHINYA